MKNTKIYYLLVVIACCGLAGSGVGLLGNIDGIFFTAICDSMGVGRGTISLYGTFAGLSSGLCLPLIPKLLKKYDYHFIARVGIACVLLAIILMSVATEPWMFYLFAILRGVGASTFIFAPITIVLGNWFNKKRSIVIGITLSFSGVCGAIANTVFSHIIAQWGYHTAYLINAALIALLTIPGTFILRTTPQALGMEPYGGNVNPTLDRKSTAVSVRKPIPFKVWSSIFIAVVVIHCGSFMISTFTSHLQSFAITLGRTAVFGAALASAALIGNVISKALLGSACEGIGPIKSIYIVLAANIAVMLAFSTSSGNGAVLLTASALFGLIFSIPAVCTSELVRAVYGNEQYGAAYSIVSLFGTLSNAFGVSAFGYIYDLTQSYQTVFMICLGLDVICVILAFYLNRKINRAKGE